MFLAFVTGNYQLIERPGFNNKPQHFEDYEREEV